MFNGKTLISLTLHGQRIEPRPAATRKADGKTVESLNAKQAQALNVTANSQCSSLKTVYAYPIITNDTDGAPHNSRGKRTKESGLRFRVRELPYTKGAARLGAPPCIPVEGRIESSCHINLNIVTRARNRASIVGISKFDQSSRQQIKGRRREASHPSQEAQKGPLCKPMAMVLFGTLRHSHLCGAVVLFPARCHVDRDKARI